MYNSPEFFVLIGTIALLFIIVVVLINSVRALSKKVRLSETNIYSNELLLNQLQTLFITLDKSLSELKNQNISNNTELNQVTKQLEHRIKSIQEEITNLHKTQTQQPEDKLYSRAFKMVELGADTEELVRECDIPTAEAEMLIAIHQKQNDT